MKTRNWDDIYSNFQSLSQEDRDEIELKVKIIGEIIDARKNARLTQRDLENLTGLKQTFIARLENNKTDPQLTTVLKILRPLGLTLDVVPLDTAQSL